MAQVIDASDPNFERQLQVTTEVLAEIGAGEVPRLLVFNKIDRVGDAAAQEATTAALLARWPEALVMSARRPEDVARLHAHLVAFFARDLVEAEVRVATTGSSCAAKSSRGPRCWANAMRTTRSSSRCAPAPTCSPAGASPLSARLRLASCRPGAYLRARRASRSLAGATPPIRSSALRSPGSGPEWPRPPCWRIRKGSPSCRRG